MVASRQVEIPFFRGIDRQHGRGYGALAQFIGRTKIPILRKYTVVAAKPLSADLLDFAAPEIAEVVSGKKNFKTAAKILERKILRKHLGSGSKKSTANRVNPTKSAKQISQSPTDIFTNTPH